MKTVLAFGTYDKFHPGHEYFLTRAKKLGDTLIVVIARDNNVEVIKGKRPVHNEEERRKMVEEFSTVDTAILGFEDFSRKKEVITQVNPDIICLGYDQAPDFQSPSPNITVVRIDAFRPDKYKSSLL